MTHYETIPIELDTYKKMRQMGWVHKCKDGHFYLTRLGEKCLMAFCNGVVYDENEIRPEFRARS